MVFDDVLPALTGTWDLEPLQADDSRHERRILREMGFHPTPENDTVWRTELERMQDVLWGDGVLTLPPSFH